MSNKKADWPETALKQECSVLASPGTAPLNKKAKALARHHAGAPAALAGPLPISVQPASDVSIRKDRPDPWALHCEKVSLRSRQVMNLGCDTHFETRHSRTDPNEAGRERST